MRAILLALLLSACGPEVGDCSMYGPHYQPAPGDEGACCDYDRWDPVCVRGVP